MNLWWVCVVVGLLVIAAEAVVPGFTIIWFGVAGIISAIPVAAGAPAWVTLVVYGVSLLFLTTYVRKIFLRRILKSRQQPTTNVESIINTTGIVIESIDPVNGTGKVRVGTEVWTATTRNEATIPERSRVRVLEVVGVRVVVKEEEGK